MTNFTPTLCISNFSEQIVAILLMPKASLAERRLYSPLQVTLDHQEDRGVLPQAEKGSCSVFLFPKFNPLMSDRSFSGNNIREKRTMRCQRVNDFPTHPRRKPKLRVVWGVHVHIY